MRFTSPVLGQAADLSVSHTKMIDFPSIIEAVVAITIGKSDLANVYGYDDPQLAQLDRNNYKPFCYLICQMCSCSKVHASKNPRFIAMKYQISNAASNWLNIEME